MFYGLGPFAKLHLAKGHLRAHGRRRPHIAVPEHCGAGCLCELHNRTQGGVDPMMTFAVKPGQHVEADSCVE
jgi:hypothetical protein